MNDERRSSRGRPRWAIVTLVLAIAALLAVAVMTALGASVMDGGGGVLRSSPPGHVPPPHGR